MLAQEGKVALRQIGTRRDAQRRHLFRPARAYAVKALHRQRRHEGRAFARADHAQAIGLVLVARDLGEELVVGNPRARGQLGNPRRRTDAAQVVGHVEVGLVERERLDVRGEVQEYLPDLPRDRLVDLEARRAKDEFGAQPRRAHGRHRRTHPEHPRLIAGRCNNAPRGRATHGHGLAPQRRIVALFHAREEGVHVDMDHLAQGAGGLLVIPVRWRFVGRCCRHRGHTTPFRSAA